MRAWLWVVVLVGCRGRVDTVVDDSVAVVDSADTHDTDTEAPPTPSRTALRTPVGGAGTVSTDAYTLTVTAGVPISVHRTSTALHTLSLGIGVATPRPEAP